MCGIAGIARFDGRPVAQPLLAAMARTMAHRGPDDEGFLTDGPVGLAHRRLAIIDLVTGRQPMTSGDLSIVFNGEIYNYIELRQELQRLGHSFETTSDTEVILKLYAEHGCGCVGRLNGMFAFLLLDRQRKLLLAARDHFGVKPLYYHATPHRTLFASEIKALLQDPDVVAEPDYDAMRDYVTFQFVLGDATLFRGIRKVPPGHYQVVDLVSGAVRTEQYWEPCFQLDPYHTEEYFVDELRRLLCEAVRVQLRSDVPVGSYLSGGMDSSLITCLAAPMLGGRLPTFTGAFHDGPEFDETRYAREVADACGVENHEVYPTQREFVDLLPRLVYHLDEPVAGPGVFPQYVVSRLAAREVKVVLGGQGGDEIFGGYARYLVAYVEQALKGAIYETNEEAEHIVSLTSIVPNLAELRQYVPMLQQFWGDGVFEPMDRRYFRLVDRSGGATELLSRDFRAAYDGEAIFGRFQQIFNHPDTRSYYNKMTHFDLVAGLPALLQVEDRVSMATSLESRVPLLDHRIADLVTSMPPRMKFRGGEMKYILKRAARHVLPQSVLARRDKVGFPVPLHHWARGEARTFFRDVLLSSRARTRGIFDPCRVEQLLDEEAAFGRRLWGMVNLELWHREFIDAA
ncbi:MAG TPA: asparagine synthase (glutamine-hydrolyzing) [Gemmatimonadales bacterium]|nr:asparagine synthase (glutamine-hydrolyzing) [Gemmatimonadales bacterium]